MRVLPKSGRRAIPGAALGAGLAVLAGWLGMAAPVLGGDSREEFFPPRTGGYDWNALAMRAATRSGEAQALLLETQAERRQAAVDTAWREPQLRLGAAQGEADEETEGRLAVRTDPASARTEPDLRPREWETIDSDAYEIGVRVYLVSPFVNQWLRRRGEAAALAKEAESREAAYAVYCEVRSLCLEAAILQEEIERLEQVERYRVEIRDIRSRQAAAAVAGALDLIEAVTRVADLRADLRDKKADHRRLVRRIALLAGVPEDRLWLKPAGEEPLPDAAAWTIDELVDLAFSRRPDLARAEQEGAVAAHGLRAAKAGLLPWFDYVEGSYAGDHVQGSAYEEYTTGYDARERDSSEWQVRFAVNVPVFDWDGKEVRLARARQAVADARLGDLRDRIRAELDAVREDYLRACVERERIVAENRQVGALMEAKIDALAEEPSVPPEDILAAREEAARYGRIRMRAEHECRRLAQELEALAGGPLAP